MLNFNKTIKLTSAALLGATMLAAPAMATQGYFPHAFGIKSKGVAGSDVAFAQSAMTIAVNPAGLSDVEDQLTVGISLFSPNRKFSGTASALSALGSNGQTSKKKLFSIPNFGYSRKINDRATFGFALYAAGGMNTTYSNSIFNNAVGVAVGGETGIDLTQVGLSPALSYKITDAISFGIAPIFSISRFKAVGLDAFATAANSTSPSNVTDNGYDWAYGFGGRAGIQVKPSSAVSLSGYYQSRIYMSKFKKYKGMFAEQGDFDIPASMGLGVAFKPMSALTLTGAYKRVWYSKIKAVGNPLVAPSNLGADNGSGFGWKDVDIFSVGATYDVNDKLTVRAGYAYNTQPIPKTQTFFNILAPAVIQHHITGGLSYALSEKVTLDLAGMVAPTATVRGVPTPAGYGITAPITLKMWQAEASAGITWKF